MDIKSLNEQIRRNVSGRGKDGLYNLFRPTIKDDDPEAKYQTYIVQEDDEMRIDLIMQKMYELLPTEIGIYLEHIDVLLTINNIDNPLNIKRGMVLKYPELGSFDSFRIGEDEESNKKKKSLLQKLGKPNKQTRVDPKRKKYLEDVALPPTANRKPKLPVSIDSRNRFNIGGL